MVGAPEARQHLAETAGAVQLRLALGALDGAFQAAAEKTLLLRAGGGGEGGGEGGQSGGLWVTPSTGAVGSWEGGQGGPRGAATASPPSEKALRKGRLAQPRQERPISTERLGHVALGGLGLFSSRNTPPQERPWLDQAQHPGIPTDSLVGERLKDRKRPNWESPLATKGPPESDPFSDRPPRLQPWLREADLKPAHPPPEPAYLSLWPPFPARLPRRPRESLLTFPSSHSGFPGSKMPPLRAAFFLGQGRRGEAAPQPLAGPSSEPKQAQPRAARLTLPPKPQIPWEGRGRDTALDMSPSSCPVSAPFPQWSPPATHTSGRSIWEAASGPSAPAPCPPPSPTGGQFLPPKPGLGPAGRVNGGRKGAEARLAAPWGVPLLALLVPSLQNRGRPTWLF